MKWSFLTKIEVEDLASFLRNLKSSGIYYTSPSSYYTKQVGFLSFDQFPEIPKPVRNALVTRQQLDQMRTWRAAFGQSVRQQTVRSMTTKGRFTRYDFVACDKPTTRIVSCKSNLQLAYDCRVRHKKCRRI